MKYYLRENNAVAGLYSKLDLRLKQIKPDALVCPEDANDWKKAIEIEDLQDLFPGVERPKPRESLLVNPSPPNTAAVEPPVIKTIVQPAQQPEPPNRQSSSESAKPTPENTQTESQQLSKDQPISPQPDESTKSDNQQEAEQGTKKTPLPKKDNETLQEKLILVLKSISIKSLWAQLGKWKWYMGAFAAVMLVAWLASYIFEKPVPPNSDDPISTDGQNGNAHLDSSSIKQYTDSIRRAETAIAELQEQITKLKTEQQIYKDSLEKARKEFKGKGRLERQSRFEKREKDFKEKTVAPLQAKINECVQNINQKSAEIATLRRQIARLKQIRSKQESVLKEQGQNE